MKNLKIALSMLVASFLFPAFSSGQAVTDTSSILQSCINLQELDELIPVDASGNTDHLYMMQYPVVFSNEIEVWIGDYRVPFIRREDLSENEVKAYFMFREFTLSGNRARINMNFFYKNDDDTDRMNSKRIILMMEKDGSDWQIVTKNIM